MMFEYDTRCYRRSAINLDEKIDSEHPASSGTIADTRLRLCKSGAYRLISDMSHILHIQ